MVWAEGFGEYVVCSGTEAYFFLPVGLAFLAFFLSLSCLRVEGFASLSLIFLRLISEHLGSASEALTFSEALETRKPSRSLSEVWTRGEEKIWRPDFGLLLVCVCWGSFWDL